MRQRRLDDPKWSVDVGLHRCVESFSRQLQQVLALLLTGCIRDHNVEASQSSDSLVDQLSAVLFLAKVAWNRDRFTALRLDELNYLLRVRFLRWVIADRNVSPFPRVGDGSRTSHARVASSNQGLSTRKAAGALIALLAMVRTRIHLAGQTWPRLRLARIRWFRILRRRINKRSRRARRCSC